VRRARARVSWSTASQGGASASGKAQVADDKSVKAQKVSDVGDRGLRQAWSSVEVTVTRTFGAIAASLRDSAGGKYLSYGADASSTGTLSRPAWRMGERAATALRTSAGNCR
jgi:hypothetical protein